MIKPFVADDGKEYYVMICSPYQAAVLRVYEEFKGRDWRRIKRELRKLKKRFSLQ